MSRTGPLSRDLAEGEDRFSAAGLFLPEPDPDKGHPIVVCFTDVVGLPINIVGPTDAHLAEIATAICDAQLHDQMGDPHLLWFREPQWGKDFCLTLLGLRHIIGVVRGFAKHVHFSALRNYHGRTIALPSPNREQRRHPLS